jgi:hypothetical protein
MLVRGAPCPEVARASQGTALAPLLVVMRTALSEAAILVAIVAAGCEPGRPTPSRPRIDAQADRLLREMSASLARTASFQVDAEHTYEIVTRTGQKLQFVARSRIAVRRPDKLRSDRTGPAASVTLYYDGRRITMLGAATSLYAESPAPPTLDATIDVARDQLEVELPAIDLLRADPYPRLMDDVVSGTYLGEEAIGDRWCHHLAYRGRRLDWQLWIEDAPRSLPCRYVATLVDNPRAPERVVAFSHWDVGPPLPASYFEFEPAPGVARVEFLAGRAGR